MAAKIPWGGNNLLAEALGVTVDGLIAGGFLAAAVGPHAKLRYLGSPLPSNSGGRAGHHAPCLGLAVPSAAWATW